MKRSDYKVKVQEEIIEQFKRLIKNKNTARGVFWPDFPPSWSKRSKTSAARGKTQRLIES